GLSTGPARSNTGRIIRFADDTGRVEVRDRALREAVNDDRTARTGHIASQRACMEQVLVPDQHGSLARPIDDRLEALAVRDPARHDARPELTPVAGHDLGASGVLHVEARLAVASGIDD